MPEPVSEISRQELAARLNDPTLAIVNVLSTDVFDAGHIPGSLSLPIAELTARAPESLPDRSRGIAIYCVLEAILASLAADLQEFDMLSSLPDAARRSPALQAGARAMSSLASDICGNCVPRAYTPVLTEWMDRIQKLATRLSAN